jgi:hypothetical protein
MERQIDSAVKRGRAYWFADGFTEIGAGIFLLLLGAAGLLRGFAATGEILPWFSGVALDFGILKTVLLLAFVFSIWGLKDRFTYPRTGYVRGSGIPRGMILGVIRNIFLMVVLPLLGLAGVMLLVPAARGILASLPAWLPLGVGILWGVIFYAAGEYMGLLRFRLTGWFVILAGIAIAGWQAALSFPPAPADWAADEGALLAILGRTFTAMGALVLVCGAAFLVSGAAAFVRYRRENPRPYREDA